jgi:RNA polymerase sigma factor (sigma-70 family)
MPVARGATSVLDTHERWLALAYEAHHAGLVRRLTAVTRSPDDAEDLAQEAYLRLASEIEDGRRPDDAAAWLHRVGWNLAMSRGRHRTVVARREAELPRPESPLGPDRAAIGHETGEAIATALRNLQAVERDAVLLAAEGYHGDEVATAIGRTVGATRTLLCRARAKIRAGLDAEVFATR